MKKLIVLVSFLLLILLIFPVFGEEQQPESCCSDCSHMPVDAKSSNDHDCQIFKPKIICCLDESLETTTSSRRFSDFHRVDGDLCEIAMREVTRITVCISCGALHDIDVNEYVISHSHPKCPS